MIDYSPKCLCEIEFGFLGRSPLCWDQGSCEVCDLHTKEMFIIHSVFGQDHRSKWCCYLSHLLSTSSTAASIIISSLFPVLYAYACLSNTRNILILDPNRLYGFLFLWRFVWPQAIDLLHSTPTCELQVFKQLLPPIVIVIIDQLLHLYNVCCYLCWKRCNFSCCTYCMLTQGLFATELLLQHYGPKYQYVPFLTRIPLMSVSIYD